MIGVIGATGHLGNVLTKELIKRGFRVRAIIPQGEDITHIKDDQVEIYRADITDLPAITAAITGLEYVFHCAGIINISSGNKDLMYRVNVEGTKNVIKACISNNIKRLIYTSSVHAIVAPDRGIVDESCEINPEKVYGFYARTKALATLAMLEAARSDLDAVILCPSGIIGPFDYKISEIGQLILDFVNRRLKAYIDGAYNFVDVRDVVAGHINAMEKARRGEVYILGGESISVYDILTLLESITGIKKPKIKIPYCIAYAISPFTPIYYSIVKTKPLFTTYSIKVLRSNANISNKKAINELNYSFRPVRESIRDAYFWFKGQGKI